MNTKIQIDCGKKVAKKKKIMGWNKEMINDNNQQKRVQKTINIQRCLKNSNSEQLKYCNIKITTTLG